MGENLWVQALLARPIWKEDADDGRHGRYIIRKTEHSGTPVRVFVKNSLLEEDIEVLGLSVRSYNCLKRCGIRTVGEVVDILEDEEHDIMKIRNLGKKSAEEIVAKVEMFRRNMSDRRNIS